MKKILLFIPAFNCEKQIVRVISKLKPEILSYIFEVLVVENRSQDNTLQVAKQELEKITACSVKLMQNKENYNLGGSIKVALLYAINNNFDYILVLHGDDQANVYDMLPTLKNIETENAVAVIGARFHPESTLNGYSKVRIFGNLALNFVGSIINRRKIYDLIAGINLFKVDFFQSKFFLKFPNNLTFDVHTLLYIFKNKAELRYIPITWTEEDQVTNAKVIKQSITILKLFCEYMFNSKNIFNKNRCDKAEDFEYLSEVIYENNKG